MVVSYITHLSWFAILVIIGVLASYLAKKIRLPDLLFLILIGLFFGYTKYINIEEIVPKNILAPLSIFALIMIIFESTSKFKLGEVKELSPYALKLAIIFLFSCFIILTIFTQLFFSTKIFDFKTLLVSSIFAGLMVGTAPDVILSVIKRTKNKILEILQFESIINTPLTVLIPLVIIEFYFERLQAGTFLIQFLQQIMTGTGAGLILGLLFVVVLKKIYSEEISPLLVIGLVLGTYAIAENISGNGILAVTTFGLVFGKSKLRDKVALHKFNDIFTEFLTIIVFILLGMLIVVPLNKIFILKSILLFGIYLLIRYLAIRVNFRKTGLTKREKLFMTLNVPKGVATVVVVFILLTYDIPGLTMILHLSLAFILYSIVLSSIVTGFENRFLLLKESDKNALKRLRSKKKIKKEKFKIKFRNVSG